MPEYLLGYDIGTSGVKTGILTPEGALLGTVYREYSSRFPGPQWVEQSISEMWEAQCDVTRELFENSGIRSEEISGVGISSQRATFAALDRDYRPLTDFIGWQDKRGIKQCEQMKDLVDNERYYRIAGLPVEPTAAVSKILWLRENQPGVFEKTAVFASTQNVHLHQLGAEQPPCDLPDAAYMGLLDVDRLVWSEELLGALDIPGEKMPSLASSCQMVGVVSRKASEMTGLAAGTPLVTAGGDLQCAGLGMGVAAPGLVSVGIGTGGGVLIYLPEPLRHPEGALNCLPHAIPGAWEMEGICLASGAAYKWYRDVLGETETAAAIERGIDPYEILNEDANRAQPGAGGLIVMPSFVGAGAPNWYPKARAAILGLTLATGKKDLTRATLEGVCLEIRWMLEAARKLGTEIGEVRIWGGAAKSDLWNQIAADVYGVPAASTRVPEAGLVGAAICAGVGVGVFSDALEGARSMVQIEKRYDPDRKLVHKYDEMFAIYKSAYHALVEAGVYERLATLAEDGE